MRIAFDTSGTEVEQAGTTTYTRELLKALRETAPQHDYQSLCYTPQFPRSRRILRVLDTVGRELVWPRTTLPKLARDAQADLVHAVSICMPVCRPLPVVVTVYDLNTRRNPSLFKRWQRMSSNRSLCLAAQRASMVLTISDFVRKEFLDAFPTMDPDRVLTTPLGVGNQYTPATPDDCLRYRRRLNLEHPVILALATRAPHKNLARLMEAFRAIRDQVAHDLVLAGGEGWRQPSLKKLARELGISDRVRILGYVEMKDLPILYSVADAFVLPSLYEGFGLPILEAMACGTVVLTSNVASMPEVAGDAAVLVNPLSIDEMAHGLSKLLSDENLREDLKRKAIDRVSRFTWVACARATLSAYERVLAVT